MTPNNKGWIIMIIIQYVFVSFYNHNSYYERFFLQKKYDKVKIYDNVRIYAEIKLTNKWINIKSYSNNLMDKIWIFQ